MILNILRKILPTKLKHSIATPLRRLLCPNYSLRVPSAGKPGTLNPWWEELEFVSNHKIFPPVGDEAKHACNEIKKAYHPILKQYGIDAEDFFWGSIKNEEAETLYQLVLERKPKIAYQIGTFAGYSALIIAHAMRTNGEGILIAVDPEVPHRTLTNPVNIARQAAQSQDLEEYILFERGWHSGPSGDYLSLGLKKSIPIVGRQILEKIEDKGIDFAFIDGDHSSSCTLNDFLLLKDHMNLNGIALFHDVLSWPTVAQAILMFWNDIHYFVQGTPAYFALDTRHGQDGLAALEKIAHEYFPTLRVEIVDNNGSPVKGARINIPSLDLTATTGQEGTIYFTRKIQAGAEIHVFCDGYSNFSGSVSKSTEGDFSENIITLTKD